jgi:hypothetical protein
MGDLPILILKHQFVVSRDGDLCVNNVRNNDASLGEPLRDDEGGQMGMFG